jgi:hypothetical protein
MNRLLFGLVVLLTLPLAGTAFAQPEGPNLVGKWKWATTSDGWNSTFQITSQSADGRFSGQFPQTGRGDYTGAIQGKITGNQIEFSRKGVDRNGSNFEQRWTATLVQSGSGLKMESGRWTMTIPSAASGGFRAEQVEATALPVPERLGTDLRGTWKWATDNGGWSNTFQITSQSADGQFSGQFPQTGKGDYTGVIRGRVSGNRIEFSRKGIDRNGLNFEQVWTSTLVQSGGILRMESGHWTMAIPKAASGGFRAEQTEATVVGR